MNTGKTMAEVSIAIATAAAIEYLKRHSLRADQDALAKCMLAWLRIKLPEALADAKEAMDCHMGQVAEATFRLSIAQAGIEAAKEAGMPIDANN